MNNTLTFTAPNPPVFSSEELFHCLVLRCSYHRVYYSFVCGKEIISSGSVKQGYGQERIRDAIEAITEEIPVHFSTGIDFISLILPYGGTAFSEPVVVTPKVVSSLKELAAHDPLHIPYSLALIRELENRFGSSPLGLTFQTSFFSRLPDRERFFALPADLDIRSNVERFGYHGLYHDSACRQLTSLLRKKKSKTPFHMISICLDPVPEICAVLGDHPVMVTSGSSPVGGICGETTCGEMDSTVILLLAKKMGWSPQQINNVLTRESGLKGLTGQRMDLDKIFTEESSAAFQLARQIIEYQILKAFGSGMAALGALDGIVFSGRFAILGKKLFPIISQHLTETNPILAQNMPWLCFTDSEESIAAEAMDVLFLKHRQVASL
jgi:acetate kinase